MSTAGPAAQEDGEGKQGHGGLLLCTESLVVVRRTHVPAPLNVCMPGRPECPIHVEGLAHANGPPVYAFRYETFAN
eukprot:4262262-Amphidinium_carterae.1